MSSNSKGFYAIALKFSAKQINLIWKKSVSVICKIMNIIVDFRIFLNASRSVFLKKHSNTNKIKTIIFWKIADTLYRECYDLTPANIQRKILMFGEIGAPARTFWG